MHIFRRTLPVFVTFHCLVCVTASSLIQLLFYTVYPSFLLSPMACYIVPVNQINGNKCVTFAVDSHNKIKAYVSRQVYILKKTDAKLGWVYAKSKPHIRLDNKYSTQSVPNICPTEWKVSKISWYTYWVPGNKKNSPEQVYLVSQLRCTFTHCMIYTRDHRV